MLDFGSLFSTFWWLLPLLIIAALFQSAWFKGVAGVAMVNMAASLFLNRRDYHLIKNVSILSRNGNARIDHIIVSRFGIFIVKIENMKGLIFGSEHQEIWTQRIFKSARTFHSPLYQNCKQGKILESLLRLEPDTVFPVVVFTGGSVFATPMPDNVVYGGRYIRYIKSKTRLLLTETQVQQIIGQITDGHLVPSINTRLRLARRMHELMAAKNKAEKLLAAKVCPECGSGMVLRTAEEGPKPFTQFWGCSTFPECQSVSDFE